MQLIYILSAIILAAIFLSPNPFKDTTFPYDDGLYVFDGYTRVNFSTSLDSTVDAVQLILWPGEREAFQILLTHSKGLNEVMVKASMEFASQTGIETVEDNAESPRKTINTMPKVNVFLEHYVEITRTNISRGPLGEYPDALIPWPFQEFRQLDGASYITLYIEVATDEYAQPGGYSGEVVINSEGQVSRVPFEITVLDFQVDTEPLPVAIGVSDSNFSRFTKPLIDNSSKGVNRKEIEAIYDGFASLLYEARVFPINFDSFFHPKVTASDGSMQVSYDRLDSAFHFYLGKTGAKQFPFNIHDATGSSNIVHGELFSDEWSADAEAYINDVREHFRANGWMDEAFCYVFDEPNTREEYEAAARMGLFLDEIAPDLEFLLTEQPYRFPRQGDWPDLIGIVDIWCPQFAYYRSAESKERQHEGDSVWIYPNQRDFVEFEPEVASPTLNIGDEFIAPQILITTIYRHQIDGLLYWDCLYWKHVDPFIDPNPSGGTGREFFGNGDGYLFYPGDVISRHLPGFHDIQGPIPSLRWKNLVQGLEDYRFLKELELNLIDIPTSGKLIEKPDDYIKLIGKLKSGFVVD